MAPRRNTKARKNFFRGWKKQLSLPGWALLLAGLTLGVAFVLLTQLVTERTGSNDGLAGLFAGKAREPEQTSPVPPAPPPAKPKLDFYTVLPEVETVLPDRSTRAAPSKAEEPDKKDTRYALQAGSFARFEDADRLKAKLALQGLRARIQKVTIEGKGEYHRVRLGPYEELEELDAVNRRLSEMGIKTLRLKIRRDAG